MEKKLASNLDQFLVFLSGAFKLQSTFNHNEMIEVGNTMNISPTETAVILDILVSDQLLSERHIATKSDTTIIYYGQPHMAKFIYNEGGYKKLRVQKKYERGNIQFTYLRHWIWFIMFLLSFGINIYLLINLFLTE